MIGQWDDCRPGFPLDYNYLDNYYTMIVIDLIKQQVLDADPKAIQQIYFTRNLNREGNVNMTMFFLTEKAKENILDFSQGTVQVL